MRTKDDDRRFWIKNIKFQLERALADLSKQDIKGYKYEVSEVASSLQRLVELEDWEKTDA